MNRIVRPPASRLGGQGHWRYADGGRSGRAGCLTTHFETPTSPERPCPWEGGTAMAEVQTTRREFLAAGVSAWVAWSGPFSLSATPGYAQEVLSKRPVAYWRLGEAK